MKGNVHLLSIGFSQGWALASSFHDVTKLVEVIWPNSFSHIATDQMGPNDFAVARSSGPCTAEPACPCTRTSVCLTVMFLLDSESRKQLLCAWARCCCLVRLCYCYYVVVVLQDEDTDY